MRGPTIDKRGLTVFRSADAPDLEQSGIGEPPTGGPGILDQVLAAGVQHGSTGIVPFRHEGPEGFSLVRIFFKPHYHSTRHSHDADCLYYVVAGEARLGNQVLGPGDGFFVPAGSPYQFQAGPDGFELLEFRNATRYDQRFLDDDPERWTPVLAAATENRERWETMTTPFGTVGRRRS